MARSGSAALQRLRPEQRRQRVVDGVGRASPRSSAKLGAESWEARSSELGVENSTLYWWMKLPPVHAEHTSASKISFPRIQCKRWCPEVPVHTSGAVYY